MAEEKGKSKGEKLYGKGPKIVPKADREARKHEEPAGGEKEKGEKPSGAGREEGAEKEAKRTAGKPEASKEQGHDPGPEGGARAVDEGVDGVGVQHMGEMHERHASEREDMHKRHRMEMKHMHERHHTEHKQMTERHEEEHHKMSSGEGGEAAAEGGQ